MESILIVDDEESGSRTLKLHFGRLGFKVETAANAEDGLDKLSTASFDLLISDVRMPGRDGLSLLTEVQDRFPNMPVIMITAYQNLDSTVAAMQGGAADYITKPIDLEDLESAVERALKSSLSKDGDRYTFNSEPGAVETIVGRSHAMKDVFKAIGMVSQSPVTVLILGESGTGKELVSRAIHKASPMTKEPFIAVNCAALVETLLESEMFGHERGAFTGAISARMGKVALAGKGTLFLDEVGELSPKMQSKLLRLLEEREYQPVGGTQTKICEARFITATNVDLAAKVSAGEFREDLFYRLNVVNITLPPLRDRPDDIPVLVEHLLRKINGQVRKGVVHVPANVMDVLVKHDWPGNIRQLENALMKAVVMATGDTLGLADLPTQQTDKRSRRKSDLEDANPSVSDYKTMPIPTLKDVEECHIRLVLENTGGHKGRACELLGISRPRLERRLEEYGLSQNKESIPA